MLQSCVQGTIQRCTFFTIQWNFISYSKKVFLCSCLFESKPQGISTIRKSICLHFRFLFLSLHSIRFLSIFLLRKNRSNNEYHFLSNYMFIFSSKIQNYEHTWEPNERHICLAWWFCCCFYFRTYSLIHSHLFLYYFCAYKISKM